MALLLLAAFGCAPRAEVPEATLGDLSQQALTALLTDTRASLAAVGTPTGLASAGPGPASGAVPVPMPGRAAAEIPPRPAGPRPATAAQLLGWAPEALRRWLGEPALRRREGTAEIWLYASPACALDLILYPAPGHGPQVAHAAARASGAEARTETACLRELAAAPGTTIPAAGLGQPISRTAGDRL